MFRSINSQYYEEVIKTKCYRIRFKIIKLYRLQLHCYNFSFGNNGLPNIEAQNENYSSYMLMDPNLSVDRSSFEKTRLYVLYVYSRTHLPFSLHHKLLSVSGPYEVLLRSQSVALGMSTWVVRSDVLWESPACSSFDAVEALKVTDAIIHWFERFYAGIVSIMAISNESKRSQ